MCRSRLIALYWVSSKILRIPLLRQFESEKSIMRYAPPKGTAGFARSRVSGSKREPLPPASTTANTSFMFGIPLQMIDGAILQEVIDVHCTEIGVQSLEEKAISLESISRSHRLHPVGSSDRLRYFWEKNASIEIDG